MADKRIDTTYSKRKKILIRKWIQTLLIPKEFKITDISQVDLNFLNRLLSYLKNNKSEDTWIEVKGEYGKKDKPCEIRKDFSCMANSGGGYILIGVSDGPNFEVIGSDDIDEKKVRMILGDSAKITAFPNFKTKKVSIKVGKNIIVIYIEPAIDFSPIGVKDKRESFFYYTRNNLRSDCTQMSNLDVLSIIYRFSEKIPAQLQLDLKNSGFINLNGTISNGKSVNWSLDNKIYDLKDDHGKPLFYRYHYLIPVPYFNLENFRFLKYGYTENWSGDLAESLTILKEIQEKFSIHYGIGYSYWTLTPISFGNSPSLQYTTGISFEEILRVISERREKYGSLSALWVISSGVHLAMIYLSLSNNKAQLQLHFRYSKIPNNKLFPHVQEYSVEMMPISVYELPELVPDYNCKLFSKDSFLDEPPDELILNFDDYTIKGYLGGYRNGTKPILPLISNLSVLDSDIKPDIQNPPSLFRPIIGRINSHGSRTNFEKPVKITGYRLEIIKLPSYYSEPLIPVIFGLSIDLNQESKYRKEIELR